jgi:hypothetical protein
VRIKYLSLCAVIVAGLALSLTGVNAASAAPAGPAASAAPPYHFSGIYLVARTEKACGFKTCQVSPLSLMIFSPSAGKYDLSANYGPNSTLGIALGGKSVWQPDISLSWTGGAWRGTGTWNVVSCENGSLAPAQITFVLHAPTAPPKGQTAGNVAGTKTDVSPPADCGYGKSVTSAQTVSSTTLQPPWWNGVCNKGANSSFYPGAEWRGLTACGPGDEITIPSTYVDQATGKTLPNPLAKDLEWQCAELAQRWLYMAFGIPNVLAPGGGQDIAVDYDQQQLKKYPGRYPLVYLTTKSPGLKPGDLSPGDIISYTGIKDDEAGHVAIVTSVSYGGRHPGYTVIEQNPPDITGTIPWEAGHPGVPGPYPLGNGRQYPVAGWLHFIPEVTGQA